MPRAGSQHVSGRAAPRPRDEDWRDVRLEDRFVRPRASSESGTLCVAFVIYAARTSSMVATRPSLLPGSLPIPRTRLIGREGEFAAARALLLDETVPLL